MASGPRGHSASGPRGHAVSSPRDRLLDAALELFYRDGFHATGIDKILAESGVAKMTLYKHFRSKDELILAALRRRDEEFRNWIMRTVEKRAKSPRDRLLAVYDALEEWFGRRGFHGCMFINAAAEYPDGRDPIHASCAEHKTLILGYLQGLAEAAGAGDPKELAEQLNLLSEGAIVMAHVCGDRTAARVAKKAARVLLDHAGL